MLKDPIIEEIHKIRENIAREAKYDLHTMCERLRKREKESNAKIISLEKEKPSSK